MRTIVLPDEGAFAPWRAAARALAQAGVREDEVLWRVEEGAAPDLFASSEALASPAPAGAAPHVPRAFVALAQWVVCHRDPARFALLYRLLLRLQSERGLLERLADVDVHRAQAMAKAVRRERHKMTAFVRFREAMLDDGPAYVAWFEPEHPIVELTAPFFVERFAVMRWSILTAAYQRALGSRDAVVRPRRDQGRRAERRRAGSLLAHLLRAYFQSRAPESRGDESARCRCVIGQTCPRPTSLRAVAARSGRARTGHGRGGPGPRARPRRHNRQTSRGFYASARRA